MKSKKEFSEKLLIYGAFFTLAGSLLLLWTSGMLEATKLLLPFFIITPGLYMIYKAYFKGGFERHIITGMFLTQIGIFLLISQTMLDVRTLKKIWPVFMLMAGISLLPCAFRKARIHRLRIIIPSIAIILLSLFFLPFSMRLFTTRFIVFAARWWPVFFIIMGITFLITYFTKTYYRNRNR